MGYDFLLACSRSSYSFLMISLVFSALTIYITPFRIVSRLLIFLSSLIPLTLSASPSLAVVYEESIWLESEASVESASMSEM